jgi:hypothetical protein
MEFLARVLFAIALPGLAAAGQAEICYTTPVAYGVSDPPPTNASVFHCPTQGDKTMPQLAAAGWQVVQLVPVTTPGAGPYPDTTNQLIVQKP